jgi:hypothetical protein
MHRAVLRLPSGVGVGGCIRWAWCTTSYITVIVVSWCTGIAPAGTTRRREVHLCDRLLSWIRCGGRGVVHRMCSGGYIAGRRRRGWRPTASVIRCILQGRHRCIDQPLQCSNVLNIIIKNTSTGLPQRTQQPNTIAAVLVTLASACEAGFALGGIALTKLPAD